MKPRSENEAGGMFWFPHRSVDPEPDGPEALAMWELIVSDFLATLPLED